MFNVGKRIGGRIYLHKSVECLLPREKLLLAKSRIPYFDYDVVSFHEKSGDFTFTKCQDFDKQREPVIVSQMRVSEIGVVKSITQPEDPRIYHHKWTFVSDDYLGFDVEESKKWTEHWQQFVSREQKARIGSFSYWNKLISSLPKIS